MTSSLLSACVDGGRRDLAEHHAFLNGILSKPLYRCCQASSRHVWLCRGKQYRTLGAPNQSAASPGTSNPAETEAVIARAASHQSASTSQTGAASKFKSRPSA